MDVVIPWLPKWSERYGLSPGDVWNMTFREFAAYKNHYEGTG